MSHTTKPSRSAPDWREIGRPLPGEAQDWATWMASLGGRGDVLYRTLVMAEDSAIVTVELARGSGAGTRVLYRRKRRLPQEFDEAAECVQLFLAVSDAAVMRSIEIFSVAEDASGHTLHREPTETPEQQRRGAEDAWHPPERYIRERAYFLWEQEGRPEGRNEEFWARACHEQAWAA